MRAITGWRFIVYIAVPLALAMLGAIHLSYDLLRRVEDGSNAAEHQRNKAVLQEAIVSTEADLARLVSENAQWDDAVKNTSGSVNAKWFYQTWSSTLGLGQAYDTVAVLDARTEEVLMGSTNGRAIINIADLLGENTLRTYKDMLAADNGRRGVVSGFLSTRNGPVAMAMAPIVSPSQRFRPNDRILYIAKSLNNVWLENLQRKLLVGGLEISMPEMKDATSLELKSPDGQSVLAISWKNRQLGKMVTQSAWSKAAIVLGFLILVMTSIGFVSLRLLQQLAEDESTAQHNAQHDHLTGLPNRLSLTTEMQALHDQGKPYAIAFADLDGFKEVNDSYGHEFGDQLIYMISNGIRQLGKQAKLCCRLGGDEFVMLFVGNTAMDDSKRFAENLIAMLKHPFDMEGRLASVGASIGIATRDAKQDVTEMLRRSDIAMYKAKTNGKNRYCVFDEAFDIERVENLAIASELKSILASRNLDIVFQPVVNAKTLEITGLEALARWPSTSNRHISPDKFIGIAENSGLIDALGELILEKACVHAVNWPDVRLAVNISAVQLNNPGFVKNSLSVLQKYGVAPHRVEFEITETSLIHDTTRAQHVFKALQLAGIKVALDDFGSGFSSIGYLRTFQFDRIKIDKSIIGKVMSSTSELAVVQGTLLVARGLSADVTAEGIENAEQASVLRLAGCTELQGYLYHKPLTAGEVTETLRRTKISHVPRSTVVA